MNFQTSKNLGGVGAILMFVGIFPYVSIWGIAELVGAILILIAMKGFADYYREAGIFNNALYAIVTGIVGVIAFVSIALVAFVDFFRELGITFNAGNINDWTTQISGIDWQSPSSIDIALRFAGFVLIDLVVLFVFVLITALLLRKSYGLLSKRTGVGLFGTTGTILLIGAVLTIIGFGLILVWISLLLLAVAFFQMRETSPPPPQPPMPPNAYPTQV